MNKPTTPPNINVIGGLPMTQDMFYSYFLTRCSEFRIRKPNRWVLDMLENFSSGESKPPQQNNESHQQQQQQQNVGTNQKKSVAIIHQDDNTNAPKIDEAKLIAADTSARTADRSVLAHTSSPNLKSAKQISSGNVSAVMNNNNNDDHSNSSTAIVPPSSSPQILEQSAAPLQEKKFEIEIEPIPIDERKHTRVVQSKTESRANTRLYPVVENIPLHEKTEFVVPPTVVLGNTTLAILVEMFYFMPRLEVVDLSNCRLYDVDPQRVAPTGNEVLRSLFNLAAVHPAIAHIVLGRRGPNQIGTEVGAWMIHAAMENPRLVAVEFDERGIEKHILDEVFRTLKINRNAQSPLSTAIRSIHPISAELVRRMTSMKEIGAIDRKTSDERQMLLSLLYDHPKLFLPLLENTQDQISFVAPAKQYLLSEGLTASALQGVRGDGKNLYIMAAGSVTIRLGSYAVTLRRGDIFGEKFGDDVLYASGVVIRRSANGLLFTIPHSVCQPLFSAWEKRVLRFLPMMKLCPILNALPVYVAARACYDAELVTINGNNSNKRIIKAGDPFAGFFVVVKGVFRVYRHEHVAKFMQSREAAQAMKEGGIVDFDEGSLFGEEAAVNRRQTSTVDIDGCVNNNNNNNSDEEEWQVIKLDAKFCSTVLVPQLQTVLVLQAKTYGSEWYRTSNVVNVEEREKQVVE